MSTDGAGVYMPFKHSFKFLDNTLNQKAIRLMYRAGIRCKVDNEEFIHYSRRDEERVENELIGSVRSQVFSDWILVLFPEEWYERYRSYMLEHDVPYQEELRDGRLRFFIPANYRPHQWKL
jgi:hypothetical protein